MNIFLYVLEMIGTVAFAVSGAMIAIQKRLDIVGVLFLGIVTAVGGGALRDLMIGVTPPMCFQNPVYLVTALVTSLLFFLPRMQCLSLLLFLPPRYCSSLLYFLRS